MQIKPKFPRFCGSVRYRNAGRLPSLYDRVLADFRLPDGSTVQAWIYTMNHLPEQAEVIPSGDWKVR